MDERTDELDCALRRAELIDETTYDVVRDQVVGLGIGLRKLERRRHRMAEIFRADPSLDVRGSDDPAT